MTGVALTIGQKPKTEESKDGFAWLKNGFYLLISLGLTLGMFIIEKEYSLIQPDGTTFQTSVSLTVEGNNRVELLHTGSIVPEKFNSKVSIQLGDTISTHASSNVTLRFTNDALVRMDEETQVVVLKADDQRKQYELGLISGQVWVNNLYNTAKIAVRADGLLIEPQQAMLNVYRVDKRVDLHVFRHQAKVSFFDTEGQYLNDFFVSEGNKVTVPLTKLNSILAKLYYSKLVKEFQYSLFQDEFLEKDSWSKENLAKDDKHDSEVRDRERAKIRKKGLIYTNVDTVSFQAVEFLEHYIKAPLTFVRDKKHVFYVDSLFAHIDDAIFLSEEGRIDEAVRRLEFFDLLKNDSYYVQNVSKEDFILALEKRINSLVFVLPSEDLYVVKEYLLKQRLYLAGDDVAASFTVLQYYLDDVYDAARLDFSKSTLILHNYFVGTEKFLNTLVFGTGESEKMLQIQNQLLDNLLLRYPAFYKKDIFQDKARFEKSYLAKFIDGDLKEEERQALISKKIDLMKRLQYFFFSDKLDLQDARAVVGTLITNVEDLLPADSSKVAIQDFFKKSLGDFNLFWGFLNNNEYASTGTYGSSNQERYDSYVKAQDENAVLIDLANTFFTKDQSNEVSQVTKEEIVRQVKKELTEVGFSDIAFSDDLADGAQLVKIKSASLAGFNLAGIYDRERGLMSDIYVGGNLVSKSPVKLKNVELLVIGKFGALKDDTAVSVDTNHAVASKVSKKGKLLVTLFKQRLEKVNLSVADEDIEVIDEELHSFHVSGVTVPDAAEALYSFDVLNGEDLASNVYIITLKHQIKLKEDVNLADLKSSVKSAYNEYLIEIAKQESGLTDAASVPVVPKSKVPKKPIASP